MSKTFHLTIARVGQNLFDGDAVSATMPGTDGVFQVLAAHEPLVSRLAQGQIRVEAADGQKHQFDIAAGGIAEVSDNQATVLL
jgi:F0F1-type ATP synthase epsilon subunit